ncbi:MAG: hypothetical protein M3328_00385, partial [Chloroflexota bacterium]|nr:hypothetical protein [Chloroflexota bacterium]
HSVVRVDPTLNRVVGSPTGVGYSFEAITASDGAVWVAPDQFANDAEPGNDQVTRIDARTGSLAGVVHAGGVPSDVKAGAGAVWVATSKPNAILRVEP